MSKMPPPPPRPSPPPKWETVLQGDGQEPVSRLRVPGGWLYQVGSLQPVYVPEPPSRWVGGLR